MATLFHKVINAETSIDRKMLIEREFAKLDMKPIFFKAIIGKDLSPAERKNLVSSTTPITEGEIGCALSHLTCYEELVASHYNSMFIFEDDIEFTDKVNIEVLQELQEFLDQRKEPSILMLKTPDVKLNYITNVRDINIYATNYIWTSHAYIINKDAAKLIRDIQRPLHFPADTWSYFTLLKPIQMYALDTTIITAGSLDSFIDTTSSMQRDGTQKLCKDEFFSIVRAHPDVYSERIIKQKLFKRKVQRFLSNLARIPRRTKEKLIH